MYRVTGDDWDTWGAVTSHFGIAAWCHDACRACRGARARQPRQQVVARPGHAPVREDHFPQFGQAAVQEQQPHPRPAARPDDTVRGVDPPTHTHTHTRPNADV